MEKLTRNRASKVCQCNQHAPSLRVLRSTQFNNELATCLINLDLSGDGTIDWVLTELFEHRTGSLTGCDGKPIMIDDDPSLTDDVFGEDGRRSMNRFLARAANRFRYRLQMRMVLPVTLIHFAREIHHCRTNGICSSR